MNKTHVKRAGTAEKILAYAVLAVLSFSCPFCACSSSTS